MLIWHVWMYKIKKRMDRRRSAMEKTLEAVSIAREDRIIENKSRFFELSIIVILFIGWLFSIFNYHSWLFGRRSELNESIISVLYITMWLLYSFLKGFQEKTPYFKYITFFHIIGTIFLSLSFIDGLFVLCILPALVFVVPLYGLSHFLYISSNIMGAVYIMIISYCPVIIGYSLGKSIKYYSSKSNK